MVDDNPMEKCILETNCLICGQYFKDPVILDCGHIFCRDCVMKCWKESSSELACPQCKHVILQENFSQNQQLDNVRLLKQLRGQAEGDTKYCQQHQEHLELFCKNDQVFVCSVCYGSDEHQAHTVIPIETAALEFKDLFCSCLNILKKERDEILQLQSYMEYECQTLIEQIGRNRRTMKADFEELHQFLKEQENFLLSRMEDMEDNIVRKREEHVDQVFKELRSLEAVIWELQEKCQQPINELLQDAGSTLKKFLTKDVFGSPLMFPLGLKWEIWDLCDLSAVLKNAMKQFKDAINFGFPLHKAQVTLDPDTAHPKFIISENRKSLILGNWPRLHSHCSKRFDQCFFVLGCEEFNTGRCYWEVTVDNEDGWGLGVAKASVKRKGIVSLDPAEGIWAMAKWGDHCMILLPPHFPAQLMSWALHRIRVSLNYIGGRLSFFDADRGILLAVFLGASFSGEPLHPFFWLQRKAQLVLC
ncbi:E3 ubiquitin-protein ligase TRIM7-like [Ahaetulla prasina]|uniref:E3 ubiquitin-protein ligase TRIM7-like n=1 Tax=Ahaetulla prasina TaxID=499056 RepID=UPI00264739AC|nr:E3 ubiquitin-protein ligase TRIM7-like [Ahaetulla prasina]